MDAATYALSRLGVSESSPYRLRRLIGPPLEEAFALYYHLKPLDAEKAADHYYQRYLEYGMDDNNLYDGIPRLLKRLRQSRTGMVALSCRDPIYVSRIMRKFDLAGMFITARGHTMGAGGSKSHVLEELLISLPVLEGKRMVMVGDREDDIIAARENDIPCLAVGYGFGSAEELRNASPEAICGSVRELTDALIS